MVRAGAQAYAGYAQVVTEWENYQTQSEFQNQLAGKTLAFQFINSYIALFWNAFWERSLTKMSATMMSLYVAMVRRLTSAPLCHRPNAIRSRPRWGLRT